MFSVRPRSSTSTVLLFAVVCLLIPMTILASSGRSSSKISIHAGGLSTAVTDIIKHGRPRLVKLLDALGSTATTVKQLDPGVFVIGRIYLSQQPTNLPPHKQAEWWWGQTNSTILSSPDVDAWEGYNEPNVGGDSAMKWYTEFEIARVKILANHGLRAVIGCFATGTPDVTNSKLMNLFNPAIDAANAHNGVLGVHEYSSPYMWSCYSNVTHDGWLTLRYRKWYNQFLIPQNRTIPLAITETGIDAVGTMCGGPSFGGYRTACSWWKGQGYTQSCEQTYINQMAWYDERLRQDSYVIGATIFQIDCPGWADYSVTPAASELIAYLKSQQQLEKEA